MAHGLLLMTALPPTKGHAYLIDFASKFLQPHSVLDSDSILYVMINGRPHEPIKTIDRVRAFREHFDDDPHIKFFYVDRDIPQEPSEHPDFWYIWKSLIKEITYHDKFDFVFASETYGVTLANMVEAKFIPFNIDRSIIPVHATEVRANPIKYFDQILPPFQKKLRKTVTIFGPESIGKTTIAVCLAERLNGHFVPEWARGYLETVGPEVTSEKMKIITYGQAAIQKLADDLIDKPFIIRDTDLLSTYGYYELWGNHEVPEFCKNLTRKSLSDVYILMNDQIPFTPDILRYGGDKRETDNTYWKKLLERFNCDVYQVQSYYLKSQVDEVEKFCLNFFNHSNDLRFMR